MLTSERTFREKHGLSIILTLFHGNCGKTVENHVDRPVPYPKNHPGPRCAYFLVSFFMLYFQLLNIFDIFHAILYMKRTRFH